MPIGVLVDEYPMETDEGEPMWALQHEFCHAPDAEGYLADAKGHTHPEELREHYLTMASEPGALIGDEACELIDQWIGDGRLAGFEVGEQESLVRYVGQMQNLGVLKIYDFDAEPAMSSNGSLLSISL